MEAGSSFEASRVSNLLESEILDERSRRMLSWICSAFYRSLEALSWLWCFHSPSESNYGFAVRIEISSGLYMDG